MFLERFQTPVKHEGSQFTIGQVQDTDSSLIFAEQSFQLVN
jgi:hypothetical protein